MNKQNLQQEITNLEAQISTMQDSLNVMKKTLQNLKDIAWDRHSKKEISSMYKVLQDEKESTQVKSNVGGIKVDKEFMQKQIQKHLDNPNLRGMVTTQEMLSFPKVAKNMEAKKEARGYTWQVKAKDKNTLTYGSRKYEFNNEEVHRLATNHSKTEANERMVEEDRRGHPYHPIFNDLNFRKSTNESIPQKQQNTTDKESKIAGMREMVKNTLNSDKKQINKDTSSRHIDR